MRQSPRNLLIAAGVVLVHAVALWALHPAGSVGRRGTVDRGQRTGHLAGPRGGAAVTRPATQATPAACQEAGAAKAGAGANSRTQTLRDANAGCRARGAGAGAAWRKRLDEQGKVLVRVLIGSDGIPQRAELKRSSGFDRLDRSALDYVMKCRYAPGKVGGVPQAMWYEAPVSFVLK